MDLHENGSQIVINKIVDWMKRHSGEFCPEKSVIFKDLNVPESLKTNYAPLKRKAFIVLERKGFKLEYQDHNNARVVSYIVPDGIENQIASKIMGIQDEEEGSQVEDDVPPVEKFPEQPVKRTSPVQEKDRPPLIFQVDEIIEGNEFAAIGRSLVELAAGSAKRKFKVKMSITKVG